MALKRQDEPVISRAFVPGAITNFFAIEYGSSHRPRGATGGGYVLSKGCWSRAVIINGKAGRLVTSVNGDTRYNAKTTRRALQMLIESRALRFGRLRLDQTVETPIGSGFGASASSATSAVYATARAAGLRAPKQALALYAHRAEILEQTGLGTVSVIYNEVGAGAITLPGEPGKERFVTVAVPKETRLVTGFLAPYDKRYVLSSKAVSDRLTRLGEASLRSFLSDPTIDTLAEEGERFSKALGLESVEVKKLIGLAKAAGAIHASQNMVGYSIHALTSSDVSKRVANALRSFSREIRVDTFEIGSRRGGVY